jgi:MraZ protein
MTLFLSKYINKIDKKGRVSVPSSFRGVLSEQSSFSGIVAYPSFVNNCIEACGLNRIKYLNKAIDMLDPYSEEREAFATAILSGSVQLAFDSEGRITIPEELLAGANLTEQICFVGKGETFELWEPQTFELYLEKSRELAKSKRALLRFNINQDQDAR